VNIELNLKIHFVCLCPRAYDKFVFTDHLYADNDGININSYKTFKNQYNGIADVSLLRIFARAKKIQFIV